MIKNLAQSIASLCVVERVGEQTRELRQQIVTTLVTSLLQLDLATEQEGISDQALKALKKVLFSLFYFSYKIYWCQKPDLTCGLLVCSTCRSLSKLTTAAGIIYVS